MLNNSLDPSVVLVYFAFEGFQDRVGCAENGQKINLPAAAPVSSHKWIEGNCSPE